MMKSPLISSADLDSKMIEEILQKIDENLAFRGSLNFSAAEDNALEAQTPELVRIDVPPDYYTLIDELRSSQAPLFVIKGSGVKALARKMINLPIKVFGHKLIGFNQNLIQLLSRVTTRLETLERLVGQLAAAEKRRQMMESRLEKIESRLEEIDLKSQAVDSRLRGLDEWVGSVSGETRGNSDWLKVVSGKVEALALSVREAQFEAKLEAETPEGKILDRVSHDEIVQQAGGKTRLNLGAGEKPKAGYINVDFRALPGIQVTADVRKLPYREGEVDEIASAHLVEHFREQHMKDYVLPYWKSLLKPGGVLRIVCPNWQAMMSQLNSGRMSYEFYKRLTFGGQDYEGDDHFAMYTPDTLSNLLRGAGFKNIQVIAEERDNGGCPEMELTAEK